MEVANFIGMRVLYADEDLRQTVDGFEVRLTFERRADAERFQRILELCIALDLDEAEDLAAEAGEP